MAVISHRAAVCYIVGHYTSGGHTAHLPRFFEELSRYSDVYVVLWSHDQVPEFPGVQAVYPLRDRAANRLLRMAKLVILVWRLRRQGCRVFFVRIQYNVASVLSLLRKIMGIHVFLWVSGYHETAKPAISWRPRSMVQRLAWELRFRILFRLATRLVTRFATGPASMVEYYRREYGVPTRKFLPLDNDVDTAILTSLEQQKDGPFMREKLGLPVDAEVMLYVGGVSPRRLGEGGRAIFEIAHQILSSRPSSHLVLVGLVSLPDLRERLEQGPWGDRVYFTGLLPLEQVLSYYLAADICIFPCTAAGFPRVLLEAMALGVPFVSFDIGGFKDLASEEQKTCVVPLGDTRGFVFQVNRILDDPSLRQRLAKAGRERAQDFSTERVAKDFFDRVVLPFSGDGKR